ncbi:MAG TPA: transketolase C-terminal domain-containing protein [Candidatus Eisenbacteria bacterium]|jgi:transketolase|nr:transketolase C-terminal domain-containing protein [Candidatus Eisenbacteria bacterium]
MSALVRRMGAASRDAYGKALVELGAENPDVIVMDADLSKSTRTEKFGKAYPERFIDIGIQEMNLVGLATGLASCGKVPFISSFACFLMCKGYEQLRVGVAFPELNVKVVTSHGGISVGEDGASQQSVEDFALALTLPGFTVIVPSDEHSAKSLIKQAARHKGPVYVRTSRANAALVYDEKTEFKIGKGIKLREGKDVTLVGTGLLVFECLEAAELLKEKGIDASVVDIHTLKPLDEELILSEAKTTGAFVVAEEHLTFGGLGSVVSQFLSRRHPSFVEFVGLNDTYAESGSPQELMNKYGLTSANIALAAQRVVSQKRR